MWWFVGGVQHFAPHSCCRKKSIRLLERRLLVLVYCFKVPNFFVLEKKRQIFGSRFQQHAQNAQKFVWACTNIVAADLWFERKRGNCQQTQLNRGFPCQKIIKAKEKSSSWLGSKSPKIGCLILTKLQRMDHSFNLAMLTYEIKSKL